MIFKKILSNQAPIRRYNVTISIPGTGYVAEARIKRGEFIVTREEAQAPCDPVATEVITLLYPRNFVIAAARGAHAMITQEISTTLQGCGATQQRGTGSSYIDRWTPGPQQYLGTGLATKVRSYSNSSQPGSIPPYKVNDITIPPPSRSTS
ncbi:hypothetical protein TWF569_004719 [Orbilia oligospora]|nr:hypothetical protein TWF103_008678 [Orbilia oligospora]KAF3150143.1 hypothetical protein TWF594_010028 [Orbilia oligospora]KAF3150329.1 hypothetical protein TWF569_004719 [Orbilia oligospora]